jgi:hypothetical protein
MRPAQNPSAAHDRLPDLSQMDVFRDRSFDSNSRLYPLEGPLAMIFLPGRPGDFGRFGRLCRNSVLAHNRTRPRLEATSPVRPSVCERPSDLPFVRVLVFAIYLFRTNYQESHSMRLHFAEPFDPQRTSPPVHIENALGADLIILVRPQCWRIVSAESSALLPSGIIIQS